MLEYTIGILYFEQHICIGNLVSFTTLIYQISRYLIETHHSIHTNVQKKKIETVSKSMSMRKIKGDNKWIGM